jgi:hypothetical protein
MRPVVARWLRRFGVKYRRLVLIGKSGAADATASYGARTKIGYGYNTFIDDNPELAREVMRRGNGERLFLYDQPWNRSFKADNKRVFRVRGLGDVEKILRASAPKSD